MSLRKTQRQKTKILLTKTVKSCENMNQPKNASSTHLLHILLIKRRNGWSWI